MVVLPAPFGPSRPKTSPRGPRTRSSRTASSDGRSSCAGRAPRSRSVHGAGLASGRPASPRPRRRAAPPRPSPPAKPRRAAAATLEDLGGPLGLHRAGPRRTACRCPRSPRWRSASIVSCGKLASASAISSARSRWPPFGTTSLTRPIACASSTGTMRPVRIRSSARPSPTIRGQPLRAAVDQRDAPAALGEAERRALGGDPQVAPQRQLEPAGQAPARDRGDRRLRRRQAGEAQRPVLEVEARRERLDRLQVGARAERHAAGAGEDQHAGVVVGLEAR